MPTVRDNTSAVTRASLLQAQEVEKAKAKKAEFKAQVEQAKVKLASQSPQITLSRSKSTTDDRIQSRSPSLPNKESKSVHKDTPRSVSVTTSRLKSSAEKAVNLVKTVIQGTVTKDSPYKQVVKKTSAKRVLG